MSETILKKIDVTNFRSIRGHVHSPLDAKVVLIHGENGAGKTSLLSAIEYGLTGNIQALHRADPDYAKYLLHRSATEGRIVVKTDNNGTEKRFDAVLDGSGTESLSKLDPHEASFFSERSFLPQSLLSQLLQIYQESRSDSESPLAKFVSNLLGLDRLDALEAGLKPLIDVRNLRKAVEAWSTAEIQKERREQFVNDRTKAVAIHDQTIAKSNEELRIICVELGLSLQTGSSALDFILLELEKGEETQKYEQVLDSRRTLGSIRRQVASAEQVAVPSGSQAEAEAATARIALADWEKNNSEVLAKLRSKIIGLEAESLPSLQREHQQLIGQAEQLRNDLRRFVEVQRDLDATRQQIAIIEDEVGKISADAGALSSVLGELGSFIVDDICPVCERDFGELHKGSLHDHVQRRVVRLSASASRLLTLGKSRGESQQAATRLQLEVETLEGRKAAPETLTAMDRRASQLSMVIAELQRLAPAIAAGSQLSANDITYRRAFNDLQARNSVLLDARATLNDFARSIDMNGLGPEEGFEAGSERLEAALKDTQEKLDKRLRLRRNAQELISSLQAEMSRRAEATRLLVEDRDALKRVTTSLQNGQSLRAQGQAVRDAVDGIRSAIIRRVFNDQLNRVWRDLFVRLAPSEPFVPAFRIPESETRQLQPKLITLHRDTNGQGGTPGTMLSAGNLNTAALTLFTALHLSVSKVLPWLILDDPVQSMDDVHIAHFAALLRTLSKEHHRQIIIAVHDRQLFEYLRLELSPAFPGDSLITLELIRGPRRDTHCVPNRLEFREETALLALA